MKLQNAYEFFDCDGLECKDKSLAQQSQRDEADINTIVKRFGLTGQLPANVRVPLQADFVEALSFQDAQNAIIAARHSFEAMPADVRSRFQNDPGRFVDFCSEERVDATTGEISLANLDEMRKLGLAVPKVEPVVPAAPGTVVT